MTPNKEDYLKVIFKMEKEKTLVSNKVIAEQLKIAPASVSEMLVKLKKEGLIFYEPYKGSKLTQDGRKWCLKVVRAHRLWEVFLIKYLNYSNEAAHKEAHLLEHVSSENLIEQLNKFLKYPQYSPEGKIIPEHE